MMLKVILYAYTQKIYSSRNIAKQLQENIYFMWLARHQKPDFRTINRFRSERMKGIIYETFFSIVDLLHHQGLVKLEHYFLDGTKLEANANKYTFVWRKSTERYDLKLDEKYRTIIAGIEQIAKVDDESEHEQDIQEKLEENPVTSDQIEETVKALEKRLEEEPENRAVSYNVQIGTENQFITGFSLHQRAGDPGCLLPHFELLQEYSRPKPKALIADSGYGSEENYSFCEEKEIEAYVKYSTLDKEETKKWKSQVDRIENMTYDEELDEWICTKTITVSLQNQSQRKEVRARLSTEEGDRLYRQRKCDVEPVFGHIKYNRGFDRFMLRGLSKTRVEWGLLCVAHNLLKWATHTKSGAPKGAKTQKKAG